MKYDLIILLAPISAIGASNNLIAVGASDAAIALIRLDQRTVEHISTHQDIGKLSSHKTLHIYSNYKIACI